MSWAHHGRRAVFPQDLAPFSFPPSHSPGGMSFSSMPRDSPSASGFATAIGVLPARHRQHIDPSEHPAKQPPLQMSLGQSNDQWYLACLISRLPVSWRGLPVKENPEFVI